jgi:hypothetical protein
MLLRFRSGRQLYQHRVSGGQICGQAGSTGAAAARLLAQLDRGFVRLFRAPSIRHPVAGRTEIEPVLERRPGRTTAI